MEEFRVMQRKGLELEREWIRSLIQNAKPDAHEISTRGKEKEKEQNEINKRVDNILRKLLNMKLNREDIVDCYIRENVRINEGIFDDIKEETARLEESAEGANSSHLESLNGECTLVGFNKRFFTEALDRNSEERVRLYQNVFNEVFTEILKLKAEEIKLLKRVRYNDEHELAASDACPICNKIRKSGDTIVQLTCGHELHERCAETRLANDARCPTCLQFPLVNYD